MATGRSNKLVELAPLRRHRGRDCPASREVGGDGSEHEEIKDRDAFSGISAKIVGLKIKAEGWCQFPTPFEHRLVPIRLFGFPLALLDAKCYILTYAF